MIEYIRGFISDAAAGSLSHTQAARRILQRVNGATSEQLLAAALDLLREQARQHQEVVAGLTDDVANLDDEVDELKAEIEILRAKRVKANELKVELHHG